MSPELLKKTKFLFPLLLTLGISSCNTPPDFEINCAQVGAVTKERSITRSSGNNRYHTDYFIIVNGDKFQIEYGAAIYLLQNSQNGTGTVIFSPGGVVKSIEITSSCPN